MYIFNFLNRSFCNKFLLKKINNFQCDCIEIISN